MKPNSVTNQRHLAFVGQLRGRHRNRALATAFMTALASATTPLSQAAQLTWSGGGGDDSWSTGANWAGTAPTGTDAIIFTGNANLSTYNDLVGLTPANGTTPASAIAFTNASNVTGGAFTLDGNAITLAGAINTTPMTTGTLIETISLQLDLIAPRTITTATNHGLTISGLINDASGTNSGGITKSGVATLLLSNNSNNFTTLTIQQGTLSATSIEPSGIASSIGIGNTITLGNATTSGILTFTGTAAPAGNIDRTIALNNSTIGGVINNSGTVPLVFNGTFTAAGASNRAMTFGGTNTGANNFQNTIVDTAGGGTLTVVKADAGTWRLSGANTYTGQTQINNGTLNVATIADSGSSNLGLGTLIRFGSGANGGILNYTGTGSTTSRTITIGNNSGTPAAGDTGGGQINNNGSGALIFTAANFNTTGLTGSLASSRTLTLGGANTGANEIQGVIANGLTGTMATNLLKAGSGTWILSGANTYTGITTINAGTLKLGAENVLPNTAVTIGATGAAVTSTLDLNGFSETIGTLTLGRNPTTVAGAMAGVANSGGGSPALTLGGALTYIAGSVGFNNGTATISATLDLSGTTRNFNINDSDQTVTDVIISGAIQNSTGTAGISKNNAGTLVLSGPNTYNGNTAVNAGELVLADDATLKFVLGATTGVSNSLTGAGTVTLNGDFVIDTSAADALSTGSWILENVTTLAGAYGTTFTVSGFSDIGSEQWEKDLGGGKKYTFDETTGVLTLATAGGAYTVWAAAKGLTGLPGSATDPAKDADPDKDGRNNLAEFAFDGDPLSGVDNGKVFGLTEDSDLDGDTDKELILTVAVRTGTPAFGGSPSPTSVHPTDGITYTIEGSLNLAGFPSAVNVVPMAVTTGLPAAGAGYEYRSFSLDGTNALPDKGFLRAKVSE